MKTCVHGLAGFGSTAESSANVHETQLSFNPVCGAKLRSPAVAHRYPHHLPGRVCTGCFIVTRAAISDRLSAPFRRAAPHKGGLPWNASVW
jgi:hypothetical protein